MHAKFLVPALALATGLAASLAPASARADALAAITVNGTTRTLSQTGFIFEQVGGTGVRLAPGESADFSFDYSIAVRDSGLPAPFDPRATGCLPLHVTGCNPTYAGFEFAKADLLVFYQDPRIIPPFIEISSDVPTIVSLQTHGDSFADALAQSGTIHVHIVNHDPFSTYTQPYATFVGLWVLAVPEPSVVVQLAAGLGVLLLSVRRLRPRPDRLKGAVGQGDATSQCLPTPNAGSLPKNALPHTALPVMLRVT